MTTFLSILSISAGASLGAFLRWLASIWLNPVLPALPLGTLAVNLIGSLLMGLSLGIFGLFPGISSQWKLLIATGFLGSLTTFSTFAAEMAAMFQQGRVVICAAALCLHVFGSILMVFLGLGAVQLLKNCFFSS